MTQLKMLSADDKLTEIRRLYFDVTKQSIQGDLAKALDLLKSMASEEERERAAVYMEGLAEMRNDWLREQKTRPGGGDGAGRSTKPGAKGGATRAGAKSGKGAARKSAGPKPAAKRPKKD